MSFYIHLMGRPFFIRAIPTYGVLPYSMIMLPEYLTLARDSDMSACHTSSMLISIWVVAFKWVKLLVSYTHT